MEIWFYKRWKKIDQLKNVIEGLKENPGSRYHLMTAWNPSDLPDQAIGPCPMIHQFSVFGNNIHLTVYQRSCDTFLGVPFNISQDSLLLSMVAKETGLNPARFTHSYGNVHIYLGVSPRADFWTNEKNISKFKRRFTPISYRKDYIGLKEWYVNNSAPESEVNLRKDHMPFVLEQLSKSFMPLPTLELADINLFDAIQNPIGKVAKLKGYEPHIWDSKAAMAA